MRVAIIGCGRVGSSIAFTLIQRRIASKITLVDINKERAEGEVLDLLHGASFFPPTQIIAGDYDACADANVIILAAGLARKANESRLDLAKKNILLAKEIAYNLSSINRHAVYLVVANPVDIYTYVILKTAGLLSSQVIGMGTVLDTTRFRYLLARRFKLDSHHVHGYILGEHGAGAVPIWSRTNIAGIPIDEYCKETGIEFSDGFKRKIFQEVLDSGKEVIAKKGATYYAIALATVHVLETILRETNSILSVTTLWERGFLGISDNVCMSIPTVLGKQGRKKVLTTTLAKTEEKALQNSSKKLREVLSNEGF